VGDRAGRGGHRSEVGSGQSGAQLLDLIGQGLTPHVVADTCLSRSKANYKIGLSLCEKAGAVVTGTETALFQLVGKAGTDAFKVVSKLVR